MSVVACSYSHGPCSDPRRFDHYEAAVDEIIASCNGDLRGAVKALMLLNEQLELELRQLHAVDASGSLRELRTKIAFH